MTPSIPAGKACKWAFYKARLKQAFTQKSKQEQIKLGIQQLSSLLFVSIYYILERIGAMQYTKYMNMEVSYTIFHQL